MSLHVGRKETKINKKNKRLGDSPYKLRQQQEKTWAKERNVGQRKKEKQVISITYMYEEPAARLGEIPLFLRKRATATKKKGGEAATQ